MTDRDRDEAGRARNARPRDASGRPLPRGAAGVDRVPEDLVLSPEEAVREAQRLLDAGLPFQAHEVLEGAWKAAGPQDRELWRGLAQVAVGLTHLQRGNARGAVALLRRGAQRITDWDSHRTGAVPLGLDLAGVRRHADDVVARLESAGAAGDGPGLRATPDDLRLRLRP